MHEAARLVVVKPARATGVGLIVVVSAGTSDLPVAEEAAVTAEVMGNRVERVVRCGVAGLHRLVPHLDRLNEANAIVAVAGMEGALPSVLGGLVDRPVIAVPTSVGYGASFGGRGRAARHAELLRARRVRGQHRQRLRRGRPGQPDQQARHQAPLSMRKLAYFDCPSGASGDMILGALVDAGVPFETLERELAGLGVDGYRLERRR